MKNTVKTIANCKQFGIAKEQKVFIKGMGSHPLNGADFWPLAKFSTKKK